MKNRYAINAGNLANISQNAVRSCVFAACLQRFACFQRERSQLSKPPEPSVCVGTTSIHFEDYNALVSISILIYKHSKASMIYCAKLGCQGSSRIKSVIKLKDVFPLKNLEKLD